MEKTLDDTPRVYRIVSRIEKYASPDAVARGEPAEIVERVAWYDEAGRLITDAEQVEQLEHERQGGA